MAQRFFTTPDLLAGINATIQNPTFLYQNQQIQVPAAVYEVEVGDSFSLIAEQLGITVSSLIQANANRVTVSEDVLYPGMRLIVPLPLATNIVITEPFAGNVIFDRSGISGYARAFEANVLYRVVDDNGVGVTGERFTTAEFGAPAFSRFHDVIPFDQQPTASTGVLEVYTRSAADGSVQDLVRVRVKFNIS
ncbi:LysM peptidoglycan-binding domain-containing protein [Halalkalibacter krulwichiae]|uniref:Immunoglobulin-like domain of bacterial spore germination n=1 Tax=Halalkalibacter krulwichiae TaxID=199441 RepID=A0A1X9MMD0_9BACI|nr:Gmad2 immunoglobulin-like domain-containing protein [Halalkalibacter krulwichiae]ARK32282.1 Immunoglobulin-like domain of bacterial spore germination [Halalkalibacter krulwichiae]